MVQHIVNIGVYIPGDAQLLDVACVDILGMMSSDYMAVAGLPEQLMAIAPQVNIVYITTTKQMAKRTVPLTSSMTMVPTHGIEHSDIQPGKLDIVFIPGPAPSIVLAPDAMKFLQKHAESPSTEILSICTGIYVCGQAGILAGKTACGPRRLQSDIAAKFAGVTLVGDTHRWVQDGNLWSSGGITNGNDMVAAYASSSKHFPGPVVELACSIADVGERGQMYACQIPQAEVLSSSLSGSTLIAPCK